MLPPERESQVKAVLELISSGNSERSACAAVGINRMTFRQAAFKMQAASQYAEALESLAHHQIEQIEQTIDDMRDGTIEPPAARIEIDTRKWLASKMLPKKYGEKIDLNHGGQPGNPLTVIERRIVKHTQPEDENAQ